MAYIESISSLLEMLYKKATYIACKSTGYESNNIQYISFGDTGIVTVRFEWSFGCGDSDSAEIYVDDSDFSDVDKAIERIKAQIEDNHRIATERAMIEKAKREEWQLKADKDKYLELKKKFENS